MRQALAEANRECYAAGISYPKALGQGQSGKSFVEKVTLQQEESIQNV